MKKYIQFHPYWSLILASIGVWVLYIIVYNGLWAVDIPFFSSLVVWYPFHFILFFMGVHLITIIIISRIAHISWFKSTMTVTSLFIGVPIAGFFFFWVLVHGGPRYFNLRGMDFDKTLWEEGFKGDPMTATRCEMANSTKKMLEDKKLAEEEEKNNIFFVGRLANYKYFNMDQAIENALNFFENKLNIRNR